MLQTIIDSTVLFIGGSRFFAFLPIVRKMAPSLRWPWNGLGRRRLCVLIEDVLFDRMQFGDLTRQLLPVGRELVRRSRHLFLTGGDPVDTARHLFLTGGDPVNAARHLLLTSSDAGCHPVNALPYCIEVK